MAFDRLVYAVDTWAHDRGRADVFVQTGSASTTPSHVEHVDRIAPPEYERRFQEATAIVSHAGMGTIITALRLRKPLLIMPRRADLHETRNDHQFATVERFGSRQGILVARDETELPELLDRLEELPLPEGIEDRASPELISALADFVRRA